MITTGPPGSTLEEYDNVDFKARFRFSEDTFMAAMHEIGPRID